MFAHIGGMGDERALAPSVAKVFAKVKEAAGGKGQTPIAKIDPVQSSLDPSNIDATPGVKGKLAQGVYESPASARPGWSLPPEPAALARRASPPLWVGYTAHEGHGSLATVGKPRGRLTPMQSRTPRFETLALLGVATALVFGANPRAARGAAEPDRTAAARCAPAKSPFVDVHAHRDPDDPERAIHAALRAMPCENAARIVFMPPPFTADDPARYDADVLLPGLKEHADKLSTLAGGGSLNPIIHESARSGDAGPEIRRRFRQRAEELLREGAAGFGEMAAEHFQGATPYQSAPPDHPLFLLLADIAAEHGVPIDLHMEAIPHAMPFPAGSGSPPSRPELQAKVDAFERLLAHNPRARIIWAHAGWDNTGHRTPALCRRLLAAHPNLYMDVKIDPARPGKNPPLSSGTNAAIDPEWLRLFQEFPDRFVVGTDQHHPEPRVATQRREAAVLLLDRLPADLRRRIGTENATRLHPHPPRPAR